MMMSLNTSFNRKKKKTATNLAKRGQDSVYVSNLPNQKGTALFLVDPQNDFMDSRKGDAGGSLPVTNSTIDSNRTASFIFKNAENIDEIYVSFDTHMRYHIAHPQFWNIEVQDKDDKWNVAKDPNPAPFTAITQELITKGTTRTRTETRKVKGKEDEVVKITENIRYRPASPGFSKNMQGDEKEKFADLLLDWVKTYTEKLEKERLTLVVWPPHCLFGSKGHAIQPDIYAALQYWETLKNKCFHPIIKGHNSFTEHYSAFRAEVIVDQAFVTIAQRHGFKGFADKISNFNHELYDKLKMHDKIYIAGQARSHCVGQTVTDLIEQLKRDKLNVDKVVLLKGGMSDVKTFETVGQKFWDYAIKTNKCGEMDITGIPVPQNFWDGMSEKDVDTFLMGKGWENFTVNSK